MSSDKKYSDPEIKMEEGDDLLFPPEEEMKNVEGAVDALGDVDPLAETAFVSEKEILGGENVRSTLALTTESQNAEMDNLLGALGQSGDESPSKRIRAATRSGGSKGKWTPAVVVEAEKRPEQTAGVFAKVDIPMGTPLGSGSPYGLPKPGPASRIREDLGGVEEVLRKDGTSKLKAVPPQDGETLSTSAKKLEEEADDEEEFFRTPPESGEYPSSSSDDEGQRLGDTLVEVEPSWFSRNRGKSTFGLMFLALLAGVGLFFFGGGTSTNISEALVIKGPGNVEEQVELAKVRLEKLYPPSSTKKEEEEPDPTASAELALDIADSVMEKAKEVAMELLSLPAVGVATVPEAEATEKKVAEVEESLPKVVALGPPVEEPVVVATPEESGDLDFSDEAVEDKTSMSLNEMLAVDLTKPRSKRDCYAVASRAGSDDMGLSQGFACCDNLRKTKGGVMASCRNLVRTSTEEE